MEFGSKNIARLVLGYLKEEKLNGAYNDMLLHSPHLQDMRRNEMKFYTRVNGMTLIDFLMEYETVYTIIQKHLECTAYFKEKGTRTPLTKQLQYLLTDNDALTSTLNEDGDGIEDANIFNEVDSIPSDGCDVNSGCQNYATSSPQKASKCANVHEEITFDEVLLAQTFLNNSGLIEKLTESINKEVTDKSMEEVHNLTIGNELNKNKINAIAQRFVENPAMVKVLHDMTMPANEDGVVDPNGFEQPDGFTREIKGQMTPKKTKIAHSLESVKRRLRSNKKNNSEPVEDYIIHEQNEDAIQSIIAASTSDPEPPTQSELISNEVCNNNVVLENSTFVTQPTVNPLFLNALMLQSNNNTTSNFLTSNVLYFDGNPSQAQISLTNQELMNIPMIICDNQDVTNVSSTAIVPCGNSRPQNRLVKLAPKKDPSMSIGQYVTLYKSSDDSCDSRTVKQASPKLKSKPKRKSPIVKQSPALTEPPKASVSFELPAAATHPTSTSSEPSNALKTRSLPPILTPKSNTGNTMEKKNRTTPRNGSHVRQLNFSAGEIVNSPHSNASPKSVKVLPVEQKTIKTKLPVITTQSDNEKLITILEDNGPSDTTNLISKSNKVVEILPKSENTHAVSLNPSWDANLRAMMNITESPKPTKRDRRKSSSKPNKKKKQSKVNLNSTEEDVEKFELALADIGTKLEDEDYVAKLIDLSKSPIDTRKLESKQANLKEVIKDVSAATNSKVDEVVIAKHEVVDNSASEEPKLNNLSESIKVAQSGKATSVSKRRERISTKGAKKVFNNEENIATDNVSADSETIKNLILSEKNNLKLRTSAKARIKNKCNMQNVATNSFNSDEIVLTSITKIKSCKVIDEGHKLILSPSKLCPTKRNLESRSSEHKTEDLEPLITPELSARSSNMPLLNAKRDLMPLLETPMKSPSSILCPITPGTYIPPNDQTPFTKAIIAQCSEIDLDGIPTPNFPITPNFPFTPGMDNNRSPFPSRPTDYSTCSSYYQPSDTEQNKSMEHLIAECKRLEDCKKLENDTETVQDGEKSQKTPNKADATEKLENNKTEPVVPKLGNNFGFRNNLIAKKDLQLIKPCGEDTTSSSSSSTSTSTNSSVCLNNSRSNSSDDDTEDDDVEEKKKEESPQRSNTYLLRSRKSVCTSVENKRETRTRAQLVNHKSELEAKRMRTVNDFKEHEYKSKPKSSTGIFSSMLKNRKIPNKSKMTPKKKKTVVRKSTSKSKTKKANVSGRKNNSNIGINAKTVDKEKPVQFHISSDEEDLEKTILEKKFAQSLPSAENDKSVDVVDKSKVVDDKKDTTTTSKVDLKNSTAEPINTSSILAISSSNSDMANNSEQFDMESLDHKVILMTHDEQNKVKPKSPKINREILKKQFSANVYIAPIDTDVEILLSITPMEFLLELPIKCEAKRKSPRRSLNILSNRIIKPAISLLKNIENDVQSKSNEKQSTELNVNLVESEKKDDLNKKEMEVENINEQEEKAPPIDDDLMNYALVGSERIVDGDEPANSDNRKRKRSDLSVEKTLKKKKEVNSEELLKHVDLDSFLAQLHGNT